MNAAAQPGFLRSMEELGYFSMRQGPDGAVYALARQIFTVGLVCNIEPEGYSHRYCYDSLLAARSALDEWEADRFCGEPGGYIKRKPELP